MPNRRRDAQAERWHFPGHNFGSRPIVPRRPGRVRRRRRRLHASVPVGVFAKRVHANMAALGCFQRLEPRPLHAGIMARLRHRTRIPNQTARRTGRYAIRYAPGKAISKQQHSRTRYIDASHGTQSPIGPSSLSTTGATSTLCYPARAVRHVPVSAT